MTQETGPIYGVPLIDRLPLGDSGMFQQMPSRDELELNMEEYGDRVVAAYEVLLAHYHQVCEERDTLVRILNKIQLRHALHDIELDAKP